MTTERLRNIIRKLFKIENINILALGIALEDNYCASCICCFETNSLIQKEKLEKQIKVIDGEIIKPWQLRNLCKYFNSQDIFRAAFNDNILIVKNK